MNRENFVGCDRGTFVAGLAKNVEDAPENSLSNRHGDWTTKSTNGNAAFQTLC